MSISPRNTVTALKEPVGKVASARLSIQAPGKPDMLLPRCVVAAAPIEGMLPLPVYGIIIHHSGYINGCMGRFPS